MTIYALRGYSFWEHVLLKGIGMSILTKKAKSMKVADLKVKAQELGLEAGKLKKLCGAR